MLVYDLWITKTNFESKLLMVFVVCDFTDGNSQIQTEAAFIQPLTTNV